MHKVNRGFTLVELLMVLAVMAVIISIAAPNFRRQIATTKSNTLSSDLIGALTLARVESIKRGKRVSICSSTDGISCLSTADWTKGWLVFIDTAASDYTTTPTVGTPIRYWNDVATNVNISAVEFGTSTVVSFVRFTSSGALARVTQTSKVFTAYATGCQGSSKSTITVGVAGMIASVPSACP